ncbi:Protein of unknown function [Clostridium amylolyticum]|uniref:Putative Se/S carrier protein-like domain-containing protein n=1 Tax=Clostridium amylolyticum TaxID=1121298 RepID=A0A1M6HBE9_9CLOT|nr:DUF3343 domain-containing protein [Clostridium amylolyticum]SHJ19547.1 Protein of unknown function [Clostridium amylolyticum]
MEYIAVFFTHSGALKYNKFLKGKNISSQLMPVPRKLSSNCGIGVKFNYISDISTIISEDIEKLFSIDHEESKLIYACD